MITQHGGDSGVIQTPQRGLNYWRIHSLRSRWLGVFLSGLIALVCVNALQA
jgi:hypothetical protein